MSDESTTGGGLGKDGTIPDDPDGVAAGHDPDGSHFNQEEEAGDDPLVPEEDFGPDGNPVNGNE